MRAPNKLIREKQEGGGEKRTETMWSKKQSTQRTIPSGSANATHFLSSCQNSTSQERRNGHVVGRNAEPTEASMGGRRGAGPQFAFAEVACERHTVISTEESTCRRVQIETEI